MTTPYTDDDVKHLVALIDDGNYRGSAIYPVSMARHLLAAGVTLPPEPDTPAEAEERYWVGDGESDNKVYERGRAHIYAETYLTLDASRIARLLNLDESVKDDVCSGLHEAYPALVEGLAEARAEVERLQQKASARAVKATALALDDARAELARERDLERDLFAGARPAAPTVTVQQIAAALNEATDGNVLAGPTSFLGRLTDALNRLLAERGGEG